jgi:hypothetical protein
MLIITITAVLIALLLSVSGVLIWRVTIADMQVPKIPFAAQNQAPDPEIPPSADLVMVICSIKGSRIDLYEQLIDTWADGPSLFDWVTDTDAFAIPGSQALAA